jgi:phosphohistidine phosphatase SixA
MQFRRGWIHLLPFAALLALAWSSSPTRAKEPDALRGPTTIYIIRHGERPESKDDPNLTPKGYQRADALAHDFPPQFFTPDFIWATAPSKHSNRPLETVTPLARALHEKILDEYADADFAKLAHDLLTEPQYSGKTILICWHHGEIPNLAKALGAKDVPDKWKAEDFDRVWVLTFTDGQVQFKNLPEKALPGDSEK